MSLHESSDPIQPPVAPAPPVIYSTAPPINKVERFRDVIQSVMDIAESGEFPTSNGPVLVYQGNLLQPANQIYPILQESIESQGYTVFLQRKNNRDEILILEGVFQARNIRAPWWFHLGLLLVTMLTTLYTAAMLNGYTVEAIRTAVEQNDRLVLLQMYRSARQFAWPLLLILGVHEMGHYIAARFHNVKVTLPFFIPLPFAGSLGTLGAVIFIKSPFRNRKQLFDVGIAGPLAGLLVALPIFLWGLEQPAANLIPRHWLIAFNRVNVPPLLEFAASFTRTEQQVAALDRSVFYNHPQALAAWFGVLLTSLNLLPMGQFDGGHVAFAVFGRRIAWPLAMGVAISCVLVGLSGLGGYSEAWPIWLIWPVFALLTGLRHPPPHDDITPIGWPRTILGIFTLLLLMSMIVITPFYSTLR